MKLIEGGGQGSKRMRFVPSGGFLLPDWVARRTDWDPRMKVIYSVLLAHLDDQTLITDVNETDIAVTCGISNADARRALNGLIEAGAIRPFGTGFVFVDVK